MSGSSGGRGTGLAKGRYVKTRGSQLHIERSSRTLWTTFSIGISCRSVMTGVVNALGILIFPGAVGPTSTRRDHNGCALQKRAYGCARNLPDSIHTERQPDLFRVRLNQTRSPPPRQRRAARPL